MPEQLKPPWMGHSWTVKPEWNPQKRITSRHAQAASWYRPTSDFIFNRTRPEQITSIFDHVEIAASLLNQPVTKSSVLFLRVQNLGLCSIFSIHCPAATYVIPYQRRILYTSPIYNILNMSTNHSGYIWPMDRLRLSSVQSEFLVG